jgi:hypothetical protein
MSELVQCVEAQVMLFPVIMYCNFATHQYTPDKRSNMNVSRLVLFHMSVSRLVLFLCSKRLIKGQPSLQ